MQEKPRLPSEVKIRREDNRYLFLNPLVPDWIITNSNGAGALKLCNGNRTIREIEKVLSKALRRNTTEEIETFLTEIITKSRLFHSPELTDLIYQPYSLRTVHLNLTSKCNLKCVYCYADERTYLKDRLRFNDYIKVVESVNRISKNVTFVFTGGEPLLSRYLFDLAEYAKTKGNKTHLLTNGTLVDERNVKQISELFDLIKISLDGSRPETNDLQRGNGTFEKVIKAVDILIKYNAPLKISMTVSKQNAKDVEQMFRKFGSLLSFAPLFHAGRAKTNKNSFINGKEYFHALSSVNGLNPLSSLNSILEKAKKQRILKCAMGDRQISISEDGDVYPCHLLHLQQFRSGNLREKNLESIYYESDVLKACRELTVLKIKGCMKCEFRFICGGACRARAYYEKGRIDVADDFCEYEKLAFINGFFKHYQFTA